jgi:hypothetical protein
MNNAQGEIVAIAMVESTAASQYSHLVRQMIKKRNFEQPKAIYTDTWPHNKTFWSAMFKCARGRLGLFHFIKRILDTLNHCCAHYWEALVDLKACIYRYERKRLFKSATAQANLKLWISKWRNARDHKGKSLFCVEPRPNAKLQLPIYLSRRLFEELWSTTCLVVTSTETKKSCQSKIFQIVYLRSHCSPIMLFSFISMKLPPKKDSHQSLMKLNLKIKSASVVSVAQHPSWTQKEHQLENQKPQCMKIPKLPNIL